MSRVPVWAMANLKKISFKDAIKTFQEKRLNERFKSGNLTYVNTVLESLESKWKGYNTSRIILDEIMEQIENGEEDGEIRYDVELSEIELAELSVIYEDTKEIINDRIKFLQSDSEEFAPKPKDVVLPKFDGQYKKWSSWSAEFISKVKDRDYPTYSKIDLLYKSLTGEAEVCVGPKQGQDQAEFDRLWNKLNKVYNNPYQMARAHMGEILDLPVCHNPNSSAYRKIIDNLENHVNTLKRLNFDVDNWSPLLAEILLRKMDPETLARWEMERDVNLVPDVMVVKAFLERRIFALRNLKSAIFVGNSATRDSSNGNFKRKRHESDSSEISNFRHEQRQCYEQPKSKIPKISSDSKNVPPSSCIMECGYRKPHYLWNCLKFRQLTVSDREKLIQHNNLCRRCITTTHDIKICQNKKCTDCDDDIHNYMLCPKYVVIAKVNTARAGKKDSKRLYKRPQ